MDTEGYRGMEVELLLKSFAGLVFILGLLLYFLLSNSKKKTLAKKKGKKTKERSIYPTLESLVAIVKDKNSTKVELEEAIDQVLKYHGKIHPKLGMRSHPDFDIYGLIILKICHHPHTDKKIILKFDKELREKNPEYAHEINEFLIKGLDSRGL